MITPTEGHIEKHTDDYSHEPFIMEVEGISPERVNKIVKVENNKIKECIGAHESQTKLLKRIDGEQEADCLTNVGERFQIIIKRLGFSVSLESLRRLDVLDLGCGSEDFKTSVPWPPVLCRTLHSLGIHVVGVDDLPPNSGGKDEGWEFHEIDLLRQGALHVFSDSSFDVVNISMLLGHTDSSGTSPFLPFYSVHDPWYERFEDEILSNCLRMLRSGGVLIINSECYYKKVLGKDMKFCFELLSKRGFDNLPYKHLDPESLIFED